MLFHQPEKELHQWEEVQPEEELKLYEYMNKPITEYMDFLNEYALTSLK